MQNNGLDIPSDEDIEKIIIKMISEVLKKGTPIDSNTNTITAGLDSLGAVCLIARCEELFSIEIEPEDMIVENLKTPSRFTRLLIDTYRVKEDIHSI